jgi:predicted small integral membrane protein
MKKSSASRHFQGHELGLWETAFPGTRSAPQFLCILNGATPRVGRMVFGTAAFRGTWKVAFEGKTCMLGGVNVHIPALRKNQQGSTRIKKVLADMIVCWSLGFLNLPWNLSLVPADWGRGQRRFLVLGNGAHHDLQQNGFVGDTCWMSIDL